MLRFDEPALGPEDRAAVRARLSRSKSFDIVAWKQDELYCFLTREGQVVDESVLTHWLEGQWVPSSQEYRRSVTRFGVRSGTKSAP